jgi:putative aldouronate transport system permease protein
MVKAVRMRKIKRIEKFDAVNYTFLGIFTLAALFPLYFVVIASVSNPTEVILGKVIFFPKGFTLEGYRKIFQNKEIGASYLNTIFYTVSGTVINITMTISAAYVLSRKRFSGRKVVMLLIIFTMYFNGGLIPTYFLYRSLKMLDTVWVMIIPGAISAYNLIIARTFIESALPEELYEAAVMDGCSHIRYLLNVVLPLSTPIIAVLTLYYAVGHWNAYFNAMIYLGKRSMYPLQLILREILIQNKFAGDDLLLDPEVQASLQALAEQLKYGLVVVASVPVMMIYPFIQKYFTKGIMIGAIKG